jgi:hypothetical protein
MIRAPGQPPAQPGWRGKYLVWVFILMNYMRGGHAWHLAIILTFGIYPASRALLNYGWIPYMGKHPTLHTG